MDDRQRAIAKAVLQMAYADGEVHPKEREVLDAVLFQLGGNPEELAGSEAEPLPPLAELLPERADRLEAMKFILQMSLADDRLSFDEFYLLSDVAALLDITRAEMEQLRDELQQA